MGVSDPIKPKESEPTGARIDLQEESLDFDPASFFGTETGGMFTGAKTTVEKDGKKKTIEPTKIAIKTTIEAEPELIAKPDEVADELPDFLKEQEKLIEGAGDADAEKENAENKEDGFWTTKEVKPKKRK